MNEQILINTQAQSVQPFEHRFDVGKAHNNTAVADKISLMASRTKSILTLLRDHIEERGKAEDSNIVATLEIAIDELADVQEVAHFFWHAVSKGGAA